MCSKKGYLDLLVWGKESLGLFISPYCSFCACAGGQLEVLKWILENGGDWHSDSLNWAARKKHMHVLTWAKENGYWPLPSDVAEYAAEADLEVLEWVLENGAQLRRQAQTAALENGNFEMLRRMEGHEERNIDGVVKGGPKVLEWMEEHVPPELKKELRESDAWTYEASYHECWDSLKWLRSRGYVWHSSASEMIAEHAELDFLKWAIQDGCPISTSTCAGAARGGKLEKIK